MLLAIEQTAPEWGGNRLLINTLSIDDADNAVRRLLSQRPDGIIFTGMGLRRVTLPEALAGIPVVLANGVPIPQQVAVLGYDNLVGVGELFLTPHHGAITL